MLKTPAQGRCFSLCSMKNGFCFRTRNYYNSRPRERMKIVMGAPLDLMLDMSVTFWPDGGVIDT